jgi:IS5 family transposase
MGHTLIRRMVLSDASLSGTEPADDLICGDEGAVYGDQAYYTHARHARLAEAGIKDRLMRRPNKHHPELPARQKQRNRLIGRVRAGVERPFAEPAEKSTDDEGDHAFRLSRWRWTIQLPFTAQLA